MIIQELYSLFGFKVDSTSVKVAEESVSHLVDVATAGAEKIANSEIVKKTMDKISDIGKEMSLKLTLPFVTAIGFSLNEFSNFSDTIARAKVLFGDYFDSVKQWSREIGSLLKIEGSEVLSAVSKFQMFFVGLGSEKDKAMEMSKSIFTMSSDLAAFNKISRDEANSAILSGLYGRGMALKQYGIVLKDEELQEEGARIGINASVKSMTELEKTTIRLSLIREALIKTGTTGAAEDSLKSFSGAIRGVWVNIKELGEKIGSNIMPLALFIIKAIDKIQIGIQHNLSPGLIWFISILGGLLAITGPLIVGFTTLVGLSFVYSKVITIMTVNTLRLVAIQALWVAGIVAVGAIVALIFEDIYSYFTGGDSLIGASIEGYKLMFNDLWTFIKNLIKQYMDVFGSIKSFVSEVILFVINGIKNGFDLTSLFSLFMDSFLSMLDKMETNISNFVTRQIDKIKDMLKGTLLGDMIQSSINLLGFNNVQVVNPGFLAKDVKKVFNKQVSTELSIKIMPDIHMPSGTPESQINYLNESAQTIFKKGLEELTRKINSTYPEVE